MKCSFGISDFLEEIPSLSHSVVFLYFFALITVKAFLSLLAILWNSAFKWVYLSFPHLPFTSFLFSAICKASSDNHLPFCICFSWGWFWLLPPIQCYQMLLSLWRLLKVSPAGLQRKMLWGLVFLAQIPRLGSLIRAQISHSFERAYAVAVILLFVNPPPRGMEFDC